MAAQLQLAVAKADSEQLARSMAEEQLSDIEKEKTMKELELKEALSRHKNEVSKKEGQIMEVRVCVSAFEQPKGLLLQWFHMSASTSNSFLD